MPVTLARHVIAVTDLKRSMKHYREILGFEIKEIGDPGWRFFQKGAACIMAGECPDAIPAHDLGDHSYFAYFEIDDVDEFYAQVREMGGDIVKQLQTEPWGMKEFGVRTVDGHRIMFGQEIL